MPDSVRQWAAMLPKDGAGQSPGRGRGGNQSELRELVGNADLEGMGK
jgi:hypothetical protein